MQLLFDGVCMIFGKLSYANREGRERGWEKERYILRHGEFLPIS